MWEWHGFGFGHGFMWLIWIVIIVAIVFLIRAGGGSIGASADRETAMEILNKRLARGEISEEEFKQKKKLMEE